MDLEQITDLHEALTRAKQLLDEELIRPKPAPPVAIEQKTFQAFQRQLINTFKVDENELTELSIDGQLKVYIALVEILAERYKEVIELTTKTYLSLDESYSEGRLDHFI